MRRDTLIKRGFLKHAVAGTMALIALLAAPLFIGWASWLSSDALEAQGGVGSVSFGVRGGWMGVAGWILGALALVGAFTSLLRRWVRGVMPAMLALLLVAALAGATVGWHIQEALPWPGPVALGAAVGGEVFLATVMYWCGLSLMARLLARRR